MAEDSCAIRVMSGTTNSPAVPACTPQELPLDIVTAVTATPMLSILVRHFSASASSTAPTERDS
ncbi:MAG: hypothetical protein ACRDRH_00135 [Pseudonocardia sp.]